MMPRFNKHKAPPFVMLEKRELLGSNAWKKLTGAAVKVYLYMRSQTLGHISEAINYEIKKPYSIIAQDTGLSRQTVRNAIIELENVGFINLFKQGGLKSGGLSVNVYRLSIRFYKYDSPLFKPGEIRKVHGIVHAGFGKYWAEKKKVQALRTRIKQVIAKQREKELNRETVSTHSEL
jgi:hypothetical protein